MAQHPDEIELARLRKRQSSTIGRNQPDGKEQESQLMNRRLALSLEGPGSMTTRRFDQNKSLLTMHPNPVLAGGDMTRYILI